MMKKDKDVMTKRQINRGTTTERMKSAHTYRNSRQESSGSKNGGASSLRKYWNVNSGDSSSNSKSMWLCKFVL